MSQNLCTPPRIYGPIEQTLFMGASIMSFTGSIGWNGQPSELTIQLVEDTDNCDLSKVYFDSTFNRKIFNGADPGFTRPTLGSPHYFRVGDFEYMGLIQSWEQRSSSEGKNIFTVKLVDPTEILAGTQLITGDYAGGVEFLPNILNVYGFAESFGIKCPLTIINGSPFGSPAGAFGGSHSNHNGMPFIHMLDAVSMLTSSIPRIINQFSPYGRLVFRGSSPDDSTYGGTKANQFDPTSASNFDGSTGYYSHYFVDLSALPIPPDYYRVAGPSISLLDAITQLCDDAGCDFYIELLPVLLGGQILKFIKVRVAIRGSQPQLGAIEQFIGDSSGVISSSVGRELRNETTSYLLAGAQQENIYQGTEDLIQQYFGLDENGNVLQLSNGGFGQYLDLDISRLNTILTNPLPGTRVHLYIAELQAAIAGQDSFEAITGMLQDIDNATFGAYFKQILGGKFLSHFDAATLLKTFDKWDDAGAKLPPGGAIAWLPKKGKPKPIANPEDKLLEDMDIVYNFVVDYARTYLGRQYTVRLPYTCVVKEPDTNILTTTETPTDSGWTEFSTILGLPHPSLTSVFSESNGKVKCFVKFFVNSETDKPFDLEELRNDAFLTSSIADEGNEGTFSNSLFIPATVKTEIVYDIASKFYNPKVVVELPQPVFRKDDLANSINPSYLLAWFILYTVNNKDSNKVMKFIADSLSAEYTFLGMSRAALQPTGAAIPLKSNVLTYGPWFQGGPPGKSSFEKDEGLSPWEYGSSAVMATAGLSKVQTSATYMQVAEMGSISVPGYPNINLGAELRSGAASLVETRNIQTNKGTFSKTKITNKGNWNAQTNTPTLSSGIGTEGDYYTITVAGNTLLDGTSSWNLGDIIIFNNNAWRPQSSIENIYTTLDSTQNQSWSGLYGPNITNISCEVGNGGITTTYSMRTYTPVLGRFSRVNAERLKFLGQRELELRRTARLQVLDQYFLFNGQNEDVKDKLVKIFKTGKFPRDATIRKGGTPVNIITGGLYEDKDAEITYAEVGINKAGHVMNDCSDDSYGKKAMMSMDGLLRPVSKGGSGGLPRYFTNATRKYFIAPPEPPLTNYTPKTIGQDNTDPLRDDHDITVLARGTAVPDEGLYIPYDTHAQDYRFFALRGPLVIHGYGHDIDNKPIPNINDVEADCKVGKFKQNTLGDSFLTGFIHKSETWPVGPVDLRFDRTRGVWTIPPSYRIVLAILQENLAPLGSAEAKIINGRAIEDASGAALEKDIIVNSIGQKGSAGDYVLAYYDPIDELYYVIEIPLNTEVYWGVTLDQSFSIGNCADYVSVARATNSCGANQSQIDQVLLPRRKWHLTSLHAGCVIAYIRAGNEFVCISDYSKDVSIIQATAYTSSTPANGFAPFQIIYSEPTFTADSGGPNKLGTVHNVMKHPILAGTPCLVYRRDAVEPFFFYLIRALHCPLCVVTGIDFTNDIEYDQQGYADPTKQDKFDIYMKVKDRNIYLDTAWSKAEEDVAFLYADLTVYCCSSGAGSSSKAKHDFHMRLTSPLQTCTTPLAQRTQVEFCVGQ